MCVTIPIKAEGLEKAGVLTQSPGKNVQADSLQGQKVQCSKYSKKGQALDVKSIEEQMKDNLPRN